MLKSLVKAFGLIAGIAISGAVCAVGMGGINVSSSLGEPLKAEIELVAVGKAEQGSLVARLASPEMFKGAGMDYPANLPKLKFQIGTRTSGESYLGLTSAQPVNEPFISVLIELSWSSGRLLREYTFLLDPPEFSAKQPEAPEVKPVLSKAAEVPAMQMRATAPLDEKAFAEAPSAPVPSVPAAAKAAASSNVATGTIKVKRGDTLSQIALDAKPSGISLERMLLALYRANGEAFDGDNMNRLKTGKILRLPEQTDLSRITQVEAAGEFRAHTADWNAYRQKLAAASTTGSDQASKQEVAGKISAAIADKSPAAQEPAKEVVRLSKGEAPGDKAVVNGNTKAMQEKIHTLEEEATARNKALKESNERVVVLEKNIKEMQRLIELKSQPALPAQGKAAPPVETKAATKPEAKPEQPAVEAKPAAPAAASQPAATPAVAVAASAPAKTAKPGKPAEKPAAPKVEPPPPSLLDDPVYMAAGAAALLALGGLGFALSRRGKGAKPAKKVAPEGGSETPVDVGSATGRIIAPPASSPETGDFTQSATAAPASPAQADDVDPLSEAELFLTFGRDAQAEEILKDALEKNPANNLVRLKLLSVYANRKDANSFSVIARQVEASGDAAAWAQAAEMGRSLEPGNPMYGGTTGEQPAVAAETDLGKSEPPSAAGLDFDLGFGAPETAATADNEGGAAPDQPGNEPSTGLDFDLTAGEPDTTTPSEYTSTLVLNPAAAKKAADNSSEITLINTQEDLRAAQEAPMDFDVSGSFSAQTAEPEKPNLDDLVFDITASQPSPVAVEEGAEADNAAAGAEDKTEAFALDFPTEPAQTAAREAVDFDLGSISLDMEAPAAQAPVAEVKDAHWHDVATKLDLAKAYQEMGDNAGAREILEEVMAEGDEQQRAAAEAIKQQLLA